MMINKTETIAGDLWIKIEKASGKLQPGVVKNKQASKQQQQNKQKQQQKNPTTTTTTKKQINGPCSEFTCEGTQALVR